MDTKEKILIEALKLFAAKGYKATSISDIAETLKFTKGALYKHYKGKRDILDCIIARMAEKDVQRAREYQVPEETYEKASDSYVEKDLENMLHFLEEQFVYWTEDEFASQFRRMITIEQYKDIQVSNLYQGYLSGGVVSYLTDFFREKIKTGELINRDAEKMAIEFYAPAYLMMNLYDVTDNKERMKELLKDQIQLFYKRYAIKYKEQGITGEGIK